MADGPDESSGRVEIFLRGAWGTICDDDFDDGDATAVCRQLGFSGGNARYSAFFGPGSGDINWNNLNCPADVRNLFYCEMDTDVGICDHLEDIGVVCDKGTLNQLSHFENSLINNIYSTPLNVYHASHAGGPIMCDQRILTTHLL